MTVQVSYARRPLARKQSFAGLNALGPDQFEGYASLFEVPDGAGDVVAPGAFAASLRRRGPADVRLLYHTPRLGLPDLPDTPELYAETMADALWRLDALCDLYLKGQFVNTPPSSPADGDAYLLGGAPSGAWSGYAYKIAAARDGGWQILTPFNGLRAWVEGTGCFIVYQDGTWTDWNALISAAEGSIASAATCDIGAAGSQFLQVTGTTAITSLGTVANRMRFLRFAGSLTLTHNATSLVLPGGANIATAAGDCALFASDGGGNWRCRQYSRANGNPLPLAFQDNVSLASGRTLALSGAAGQLFASSGAVAAAPALSFNGDGDTGFFSAGANAIGVAAGGAEIARFDSGGRFLLGTTANLYGEKATIVQGADNCYSAVLKNSSADPYGLRIEFSTALNNTGTTALELSDGTYRLKLFNNGNIVNANNSYGAISDIALKQDIAPASSQWQDVKLLARAAAKFRLRSHPAGPLMLGFIAQEVEKISPGLVYATPDEEGGSVRHVNYSVAYMKAFKALGEALERIEQMEARLAALAGPHDAG